MQLYARKLVLLLLIAAVYAGVSIWVPYSKKWVLQDVMNNQARLYFATQSRDAVREKIISKAEDLRVPLKPDQVSVQNINGEIIYIELDLHIPYNILTYRDTMSFTPKIFGLIRGFSREGRAPQTSEQVMNNLETLSDSTREFLRRKTETSISGYIQEFFAR